LCFKTGRLAGHCQRNCQQTGVLTNNFAVIRADAARIRPLSANGQFASRRILTTTVRIMRKRHRMFWRNGVFYVQDDLSGKQESLHTRRRADAERLFHARNEAAQEQCSTGTWAEFTSPPATLILPDELGQRSWKNCARMAEPAHSYVTTAPCGTLRLEATKPDCPSEGTGTRRESNREHPPIARAQVWSGKDPR
jgi:hypothetical protein